MSAGAGLLLADKPPGISSHDVVARARHALAERRVGHAGTLDPFASGLLILLVGRATRLQHLFMALPKTYEVVAQLGARSSTGDVEGEIVETGVLPPEPLALPRGLIRQRPPAYSAVKIDGERAYARARRGESFELPEREVEIYAAEELWRDGTRVALRISCSSGTYIRSLVADLGDAYCVALRRTRIGPFDAAGAWSTEGPAELVDIRTACEPFLPVIELDSAAAAAVAHGKIMPSLTNDPVFLLAGPDGSLLALGQRSAGEERAKLRLL
ncbi:MAG: tRNA pseudouridine(55) synthase TruB [Solirubrobacteraceae bacterium]